MQKPDSLHVDKPWGSFDQYALNTPCTVKILTCNPGQQLSLQRHSHRDELWVALDPGVVVDLDSTVLRPSVGEEIWLPQGSVHRLRSEPGAARPVRVLEVSLGTFDEADIERLQDDYGRR
ncbi:MAG: phosphomannose isomerase type II C-terminal cupin domain [Acidobacteria bacterium]|nr:phosphomannose isomerase type II C-terminal cupin domain [Acidobacteriota bacterium]MBI3488594.1 phosphomannose isomerase type II C-terminal cupin domain [Acidobacteriota bacterium]